MAVSRKRIWKRGLIVVAVSATALLAWLAWSFAAAPNTLDDLDPNDYKDAPRLKAFLGAMKKDKDFEYPPLPEADHRFFEICVAVARTKSSKVGQFFRYLFHWACMEDGYEWEALANGDYYQDAYIPLRRKLALLLGTSMDKRAVEPLLLLLEDQDSNVRKNACESLGKIGGERAVEPLIRMLEDENLDVEKAACVALGMIGDERAAEPLGAVFEAKDGLGNGNKDAVEDDARVVFVLFDGDLTEKKDVEKAACVALGKIGGEKVVEPLLGALADGDADIKVIACEILGKIGAKRAVEGVLKTLGSENNALRGCACEVLGEIAGERAVAPLIRMLGDQNEYVRSSACVALGKIGDKRAVEPLIEMLGDENSLIRENACRALGRIGDERAREPLGRVAGSDKRAFVRAAAREALERLNGNRCSKDALRPSAVPINIPARSKQ